MAAGFPTLSATIFADRELSRQSTWYSRVWQVLSTALTSRLGDNGWVNITAGMYSNGWTANSGSVPRYRVRDGVLMIHGVFTGGTLTNQVMFTLPAGYRVSKQMMTTAYCGAGSGGFCRIDVFTDGTVRAVWPSAGGVGSPVCLDIALVMG